MEELVSIIVPVYNVEKYINKCLESLINQTYKNIEIIVINDGSTDRSGEICQKWAERYHFVYIAKSNEGLGATRNLGVKIAKGEYILFVDSDDWMEFDAVEKMASHIQEDASIDFVALSRYFEFDDKIGELNERKQNPVIGIEPIYGEIKKRLYLQYGFVVMWGKLFRKQFLLNNEIWMPSISHEDNAVFPTIIFNAKKIGFCDKPMYYYRINRSGSILSDVTHYQYMSDACDHFLKYFISHGMLEAHFAAIKHYVETRLRWCYESYCQQESDIELQKAVFSRFAEFRKRYFGEQKPYWEYRFILLGSFGSRWVIHHLSAEKHQLAYHIPFSSVIAQMKKGQADRYEIVNKNEFRSEKIKDDIRGTLYSMLGDSFERSDFFFIDFLEERYDVAKLDDGNYITLSEAYADSSIEGVNIKQIVKVGTEEYFAIWKKSCRKLTDRLKEKYQYNQIILIKSRLATKYRMGEGFVEYPGKEKIEAMNRMVERMENYFINLMEKQIQIYTYPEETYTEENFRLGTEPQYLGSNFYFRMNMRISTCFDCNVE